MENDNQKSNTKKNGTAETIIPAVRTTSSKETSARTTTTTTTSSSSATGGAAVSFFQDEQGKPRFPLLYNMRRPDATFAAVKHAGKQAFSVAQTGLQKGFEMAQSKLTEQPVDKAAANKDQVNTSFGKGTLMEFRQSTETYVVKLSSGGILYTKDKPTPIKKPVEANRSSLFTNTKKKRTKTVLELNATFMEWEKAKQEEVEKECQQLNIHYTEETKHKCFTCLKEEALKPKAAAQPSSALFSDSQGKPMFPRLYKWRQSGEELVKENTKHVKSVVSGTESPCLLCASVCCSKHSSAAFRKEGVTLCLICVQQLEENNHEKAKLPQDVELETQRLVDIYGRALLLLQYCTTYMLPTADKLEQQTKQHNEIAGVGGSSVGLASGVLGVMAAATILTPVGPPLLLGSLVMGGSATAVQAGGEAYKYYSEPNQLANRILTLQGIVEMCLVKFKSMRETTLVPFLDKAVLKLEVIEEIPNFARSTAQSETKIAPRTAGTCIGSTAATSAAATFAVQEGAMAGRFVSRATTAAARTARVARFAGGALSAATLVLEARELRRTLDQMEKGNPCEKAQTLRQLRPKVELLPSLEKIQNTCQTYVKVRSRELFQEAMTKTIDTAPLSSSEQQVTPTPSISPNEEDEWQLVEEVVASLEHSSQPPPNDDNNSIVSDMSFCNIDDNDSSSFQSSGIRPESKSSLLGRLIRFKEREARKEQASSLDLVV
mmetsp:Transcript_17070/g.32395  ORF Transcript_17070/g.32395 Transcript_17070/m.32395 type:complete len:718 (-) Transcript_17070:485-2638(-)